MCWGHSEEGTLPTPGITGSPGRLWDAEATLTLAELDKAQQNDQSQSQEFGGGEGILDPCGGLHAVTVHGREQHCGERAESESHPTGGRHKTDRLEREPSPFGEISSSGTCFDKPDSSPGPRSKVEDPTRLSYDPRHTWAVTKDIFQ